MDQCWETYPNSRNVSILTQRLFDCLYIIFLFAIKYMSSAPLVLSEMISTSIMSSMNMAMDYSLVQRAVLVYSRKTPNAKGIHLPCCDDVEDRIRQMRSDNGLIDSTKILVLISLATNEMVKFMCMYPDVWYMDCTSGTNREKKIYLWLRSGLRAEILFQSMLLLFHQLKNGSLRPSTRPCLPTTELSRCMLDELFGFHWWRKSWVWTISVSNWNHWLFQTIQGHALHISRHSDVFQSWSLSGIR